MKIKQVIASVALSFLIFSSAYAQDIKTDSIGSDIISQSEENDSKQALSDELSQIKAQLTGIEKEQQFEKIWKRKKYWKIGIGNPNIERTDGEPMAWNTDFSIFIQRGKTVYLHSKPIADMIKIGIDYGFMDISYAKLKLKTPDISVTSSSTNSGDGTSNGFDEIVSDAPTGSVFSALGVDLGMHKFEYGLHVGPSVSVNPWNALIVAAYFHIMPTASGIVENDRFSYGFGCAMSAGLSVSYKALSVGVEGLWSSVKYRQTSFNEGAGDDSESEEGLNGIFAQKDFKLKQKGPRFYVSFRF